MTSNDISAQLNGLFEFLSRIPLPLPDRPAGMTHPSQAIIREIRLDKSGTQLKIDFSKRPNIVPLNNNGNGDEFMELLRKIAKKSHAYGPDTTPKKPDLSLNNKKLSYIIFRLSGKIDWQFAHDFPPISLSPDAYNSSCYFEASRVDDDGNVVPMLDRAGNIIRHDGCHVAYFIADGDKAVANNPAGYIHAYNINVDILDLNGNNIEHRLAVTIDPDVRNPGGGGG